MTLYFAHGTAQRHHYPHRRPAHWPRPPLSATPLIWLPKCRAIIIAISPAPSAWWKQPSNPAPVRSSCRPIPPTPSPWTMTGRASSSRSDCGMAASCMSCTAKPIPRGTGTRRCSPRAASRHHHILQPVRPHRRGFPGRAGRARRRLHPINPAALRVGLSRPGDGRQSGHHPPSGPSLRRPDRPVL